MASVFLGINDRTFTYESTAARAEHVGAGVRYPIDFALTADDVAYILNRGREDRPDGTRLSVIRLGEQGEEYISEFGSYGEDPGQFIWPVGIALDQDTNVYITDEWCHRITKYNKDGEYLSHWGVQGAGDGELDRPTGLPSTTKTASTSPIGAFKAPETVSWTGPLESPSANTVPSTS
jgi:hypothetical protein